MNATSRVVRIKLEDCEFCGSKFDPTYACSQCCEHEFDAEEGYLCLNCGADGFEHMVAAAEYACEGDR